MCFRLGLGVSDNDTRGRNGDYRIRGGMIWGCFNNNKSLTGFMNLMAKTKGVNWSKLHPIYRSRNEANIVHTSANSKDDVSNTDNDDGTKSCGDMHEIVGGDTEGDVHANRDGTNGTLINDIGLDGVKTVVGDREEGAAGDTE